MLDENEKAQRIAELEQALAKYGRHFRGCPWLDDCRCGFQTALDPPKPDLDAAFREIQKRHPLEGK